MKTLNLKTMLAVLFFAAITMVSCKKNKDDIVAPAAAIEGQWIGKYGSGGGEPVTFLGFNILPNGVLQVLKSDKTVSGTGTWVLEDEQTFKGIYKHNGALMKFNIAAKYDAAAKTITGSWGEGETVAADGEFFLNKQ